MAGVIFLNDINYDGFRQYKILRGFFRILHARIFQTVILGSYLGLMYNSEV